MTPTRWFCTLRKMPRKAVSSQMPQFLERTLPASRTKVLRLLSPKQLDKFKVDMFFKFKSGIEAKDYSNLAQLQNLEEVEVQNQWILDALYEVQDSVE